MPIPVLTRSFLVLYFLGCLHTASFAQAQDLEFTARKIDGKVSSALVTLTTEEKKETGVVLQDQTFVEYTREGKDNLVRYYAIHRRVHLNDSKAVEMYNKIILPVRSTSDLLAVRATAITPSGAVKEVGMESVKEIEEEGRRYKLLAVEGLEVGGEIDYYFILKGNSTLSGSDVLQKELPVRSSSLHIVAPKHLIFEGKVYNTKTYQADTLETNEKRILSFEFNGIPALYEEKYAASDANRIRVEYKLAYNDFRGADRLLSWNEAGKRYYQSLHYGEEASAKAISKFLQKEKIAPLPQEKAIRAIENYIKTNIAVKPEAAEDIAEGVLKKKFGDEPSVMRLYIALLGALHIDHTIVVGCSRYEQQFDRDFETWNYLDQYLIYFPGTHTFLDPLSIVYRYGMYSQALEGTDALFISTESLGNFKSGVSSIDKIPVASFNENKDKTVIDVSFDTEAEELKLKINKELSGHMASGIRPVYFLSNAEDRAKLESEYLKAYLKDDAVLSNVVIQNFNINSEEINAPFVMKADATLKSSIEKLGNRTLLKVGELIGPQVEMYDERVRQQPVDVGMAHSYIRTIQIHVPDGYKLTGLENLKRELAYGEDKSLAFVSGYTLNGNLLTIEVNEYYKQISYPLSEYENFRKVINASADFNKITLLLEKK